MEKIILVHYINIGNMIGDKVNTLLQEIIRKCSPKEEDDNIISYWIPIKSGETRVECINPKLVSEEDFLEAKRVLDRSQEIINEFLKNEQP